MPKDNLSAPSELARAGRGDSVSAEFELRDESGCHTVEGPVTNVTSGMCEDGRTEWRAVALEPDSGRFDYVKFRLLTDTKSPKALMVRTVQVKERTANHGQKRELEAIDDVEVKAVV